MHHPYYDNHHDFTGTPFIALRENRAMTSKNSKDQYPGYPHYPADEDITRAKNNNGKEIIDNGAIIPPAQDAIDRQEVTTDIMPGTDADITPEELQMLDEADQNMDSVDSRNLKEATLDNTDDDGELLNEVSSREDLTGEDLDVPGNEDDEATSNMGMEDEENNYYSLGGDDQES